MFSPTRETTNPGVYVGRVKRVSGATVWVEVPHLAPGYEYPARGPHGVALAAGHAVAVSFLDGGRDELVVLVRLA